MNNKKNKNNDSIKYNSIIDEFHRSKKITKKLKFKKMDINFFWECFLISFKKTFHIKRDLQINLEFNLKIANIHSLYKIEKLDINKKELKINWKHNNDEYWMLFKVKKAIFGNILLKITENIYRSTPFWGLQDTAGFLILKRNFKKQMKNFKKSIIWVIQNNNNNA